MCEGLYWSSQITLTSPLTGILRLVVSTLPFTIVGMGVHGVAVGEWSKGSHQNLGKWSKVSHQNLDRICKSSSLKARVSNVAKRKVCCHLSM